MQAQLSKTTNATTAINRIRNAASLGNYSGATDLSSLINEVPKQRRYSLFGEGHRWIDMGRYDRLNQLPIDRPGDDVWSTFPRPCDGVITPVKSPSSTKGFLNYFYRYKV